MKSYNQYRNLKIVCTFSLLFCSCRDGEGGIFAAKDSFFDSSSAGGVTTGLLLSVFSILMIFVKRVIGTEAINILS